MQLNLNATKTRLMVFNKKPNIAYRHFAITIERQTLMAETLIYLAVVLDGPLPFK